MLALFKNVLSKQKAGPSGLDADFWRRAIGSKIFGKASDDLCHAIALMARQLCSYDLEDPESISALMSCRLIPLDKCPGIRPIGIGEVLRRIIGKAVVSILKPDILNSTGYTQLCAGQEPGCEVAVHCVNDLFQSDENHGFIQIDASNAFNSINRNILLGNIKIICPEIATYIINCYIRSARLFVMGGKEMTSSEGTTQGDPIAMSMYAMGLMPLLTTVAFNFHPQELHQIAFADDLTGIGKLHHLKSWWDSVIRYGPSIGYYVNQRKSWLIVKEQYLEEAKTIFSDCNIEITSEGHSHLGAIIGNEIKKKKFMTAKLLSWINELEYLTTIAKTQPHAAYAAFTHGLRHRYVYIMRTVPEISDVLKPLDNAINNFLKVLLNGYNFNPCLQNLEAWE